MDPRSRARSAPPSGTCSVWDVVETIPYYSQFTTPELTIAIIRGDVDPRLDPRWREYGTDDVEEYAFWCMRSCGIQCLKMAIEAFAVSDRRPTVIELIRQGLELGGYVLHNEQGEFVDFGWIYHPLVELAVRYGLHGQVITGVPHDEICTWLSQGFLVIASVSPEIGEYDEPITRRGGHLVLIHGFELWEGGGVFMLHNPSGRHPDTRANAAVDFARFADAFAGRGFVLRPQSG